MTQISLSTSPSRHCILIPLRLSSTDWAVEPSSLTLTENPPIGPHVGDKIEIIGALIARHVVLDPPSAVTAQVKTLVLVSHVNVTPLPGHTLVADWLKIPGLQFGK